MLSLCKGRGGDPDPNLAERAEREGEGEGEATSAVIRKALREYLKVS
jgi:hypothetical protein